MPPYWLTAPAPALYAVRASGTEPNRARLPERIFAAAPMACAGSKALTPAPAAVDGISCMSPCAPAGLTAWALPPDSCWATAASRPAGRWYCASAAANWVAYAATDGFRPAATSCWAERPAPSTDAAGDVGRIRRIDVGAWYTSVMCTVLPGSGDS